MGAIQYGYKVPMLISSRPMACPEPNVFKFIKITKMEEQQKLLDAQNKSVNGVTCVNPVSHKRVTFKRPLESDYDDSQPKRATSILRSNNF